MSIHINVPVVSIFTQGKLFIQKSLYRSVSRLQCKSAIGYPLFAMYSISHSVPLRTYYYFSDEVDFDSAKQSCTEKGLMLATPVRTDDNTAMIAAITT